MEGLTDMAHASDGIVYIDGDWKPGSTPIIRADTHGFHLATSVFDGARAFEGVTPDLDRHCARLNVSANSMGLKAIKSSEEIFAIAKDGLKKLKSNDAVYIRPMYWPEDGGYMNVPPDPESTRFLMSLRVAPMLPPTGFSITVSPYRRPTPESATTDAKAGCLYPNSGRMILEARARGFDNALVRDMLGNVVETATSNIFLVKDGVVMTSAANGSFLAGITRARVLGLLGEAGETVVERTLTVSDFAGADEIFSTGNHSKVVPVIRFEDRHLQAGPVAKKARKLYWDWAKSKGG